APVRAVEGQWTRRIGSPSTYSRTPRVVSWPAAPARGSTRLTWFAPRRGSYRVVIGFGATSIGRSSGIRMRFRHATRPSGLAMPGRLRLVGAGSRGFTGEEPGRRRRARAGTPGPRATTPGPAGRDGVRAQGPRAA